MHVLNDPTPRLSSGFARSIAVVGDAGTDGIRDLLVGDIEDGFIDPDVGLSEAFLFVSSSEVTIQIMTESINPKRHGVIPVAVLTTPDFDATGVNPSSIRFGPAGATEAHGMGHLEDVDADGDMDLVLHFDTASAGIACGDAEASLTGRTVEGQAIIGSDGVLLVGCP